MDALIRQLRAKYPNEGKLERAGSSAAAARDKQLAPSRTQSFRGDKKRGQNWLRRQVSGHWSQDFDSSTAGEYPIAVAAAAFAVKSLEEKSIGDEKEGHHIRDTSTTKIKKKEDQTARVPEPRAKSIKFSDEVSQSSLDAQDRKVQITSGTSEERTERAGGLVPALKKKLSFGDVRASSPAKGSSPESTSPEEERIGSLLPSVKKAPTSADKSLDKTPSRKPESTEPEADFPPLKQPQPQPVDSTRKSPTKPAAEENTADAWEQTELARIKEKYEKLNTTILEWESKKKKKAKRKLERIEAELDKRRAKALQHYRGELARIDGIAGGARSQAIENRKNEEFKAKEKANKIRITGKLPTTCLCC